MSTSRSLAKRFVPAVVCAGVALMLPSLAVAGDAMKEVATAAQHAGYAAGSKDIKGVHMHLHHTINCLVGPDGVGFDSNELNPCKALGDGAIPDTSDSAKKQALQEAVVEAQSGLATDDLAAAQKAASETEAMLKKDSM